MRVAIGTMDGRACVVCREPVGLANSIQHKCGHRTHGLCLRNALGPGEKPDFEQCAHCRGDIDASAPLMPENEPTSYQGRDYVANPPTRASVLSKIKGLTRNWVRVDKNTTQDVHYLIGLGPKECPIDWLIRTKPDMSLHRLLAEGITIDTLIGAEYAWPDLCIFRDIHEGGDRAIQALGALQCDATHFRDHPRALPFEEVAAHTGLTPRHMVEVFGLYFPEDPPGAPMAVAQRPSDPVGWCAQDLVRFGFTDTDLHGAGMQWVEQYVALCPDDDAELALFKTPDNAGKFLNALGSVEEMIQEEMYGVSGAVPHSVEPVVAPRAPVQYVSASPPMVRTVVIQPPVVRGNGRRFGHGLRRRK